jgi:hypothetical protein
MSLFVRRQLRMAAKKPHKNRKKDLFQKIKSTNPPFFITERALSG